MRPSLALMLVLVPLSACSKNSVAFSNLDTEFARSFCEYVKQCPQANFGATTLRILVENASSQQSCIDYVMSTDPIDLSQYQASMNAGRLSYDGNAARACLDSIVRECRGFNGLRSDPCSRVFTGHVALGGYCSIDEECAGDSYCADAAGGNACLGICTPAAEVGQACNGASPHCDPNVPNGRLVCDTTSANPNDHCIFESWTQVGAGQPCGHVVADGDNQVRATCTGGLYCRITVGDVGSCATPIALNGACQPNVDVCQGDAICRPGTGGSSTCTPVVVQNQPNTVCEPLGPDFCNPLSRLDCVNNVCQTIGNGTVGANCRTAYPSDCNTGLYCDPNPKTCATKLPNASPCDPGVPESCVSGFCNDVSNPASPVCSDPIVCM